MIQFTSKELDFIKKNECCRLSTSVDGKPHVVPVSYLFYEGHFYFATDYKTKKFSNIKKNPNVGLVIDIYNPSANKGLTLQGISKIHEQGQTFSNVYTLLFEKFDWVKKDPWKEYEAPIIEITATAKSSWGIN
ncbi:pyridoxamine 5'-phosphate oxidase family protein [Candidatus Nitrosocosmicus hydrocola]|uniref:pyridoxamine 5'-phosphate oxidase family protein n=1 Tax=Candidatus Nitrosocosmicus hydrocola TaxID=1826872 RepID=UPI0011E5EE63|nr:pyridoxamine 5'-phosphate oxidase family protein [Candidatus Nitrosocosmicus hydrocola]